MAVGSIVARILTQYSDKGSKAAAKDINKLGKSFDQFAKRSAKAFGLAAAASAAFAIKIGKDAVQGAMEDQKQQLALATALRNTTGATDEAIAATVQYLDKLELLVGVDNNELIPSLQVLTQATRDVSAAQQLQSLALDISAGSGKDLAAVSLALAKALGGNVGALTRLGVPLDAAAVKSKDLNAIITSLGATFAGQAEKRAGTLEFRMKTLGLAFNQILDQLGYALIPVLENFAAVVTKKILPAVNDFVKANQQQLAASFAVAAEFAVQFLEVAVAFGNWVANNTGTVKFLAGVIATMFVVSGIASFLTMLATITAALVALRTLAVTTGVAMAFATGGTSAIAGAVGAAAVVAAVGASYGINKYGSSLRQAESTPRPTMGGYPSSALGGSFPVKPSPVISGPASDLNEFLKNLGKTMNTTAKASKALLTEKQKELNLKLKELGIVTTEQQDAITQMAILKNAERQKRISNSTTIGIGGSGALGSQQGGSVVVNVAGSVSTENDLITAINDGLQRTTRRSFGGGGRFAPVIK
jgi:hypothetical protein